MADGVTVFGVDFFGVAVAAAAVDDFLAAPVREAVRFGDGGLPDFFLSMINSSVKTKKKMRLKDFGFIYAS